MKHTQDKEELRLDLIDNINNKGVIHTPVLIRRWVYV